MGSDVPWPAESPLTRDQTCVPGIGRWILIHWDTREVLHSHFRFKLSQNLNSGLNSGFHPPPPFSPEGTQDVKRSSAGGAAGVAGDRSMSSGICSLCVRAGTQLCQTLWDPMDYSPPGSSVLVILQARILEWVSMPSSRRSSRPRDPTHVSCISCIGRRVPPGKPHLVSSHWLCLPWFLL